MAWKTFVSAVGVSMETARRWRQAGWIAVLNIGGTPYVARGEIRRFNARLAAGDFAAKTYLPVRPRAAASVRRPLALAKEKLTIPEMAGPSAPIPPCQPLPVEALPAYAPMEEGEPPMAWKTFVSAIGVSKVTAWRWRQAGWIAVLNIAGRPYVARGEIRRFNARSAAGDFAAKTHVPVSSRAAGSVRIPLALAKEKLTIPQPPLENPTPAPTPADE